MAASPPVDRSVQVGVPAPEDQFPSNAVKTAVYTPYNFLPKNLFKQFTRFSNMYFLFITVLQLLPDATSSNGVPTMVLPLAFILLAPTFTVGMCESLRVGELVRVAQDEEIPADMVPVASSAGGSGQFFVMTANLDGESSLKPRYVPRALCGEPFASCFSPDGQSAEAAALTHLPPVRVVCEPPSGRIDKFRGELSLTDGAAAMLDITNILFRGTRLKDTAWMIGAVVYTGSDTRVQQNASETPIKRSWLYNFINRVTFYIVLVQVVILVVAVLVQKSMVSADSVLHNPYIPDETKRGDTVSYVWLFLAYMLLFSNFVPISLQVTVDFTRYFQARAIAVDCESLPFSPSRLMSTSATLVDATDSDSKRLAVHVQSSELNEELGLVEHVFSDKTGTLTCNRMEFCSCHIDGRTYEYERDGSLRAVDAVPSQPVGSPSSRKSVRPSVSDPNGAASAVKNVQVRKFLLNLAVNNNIFPTIVGVGGDARDDMGKTEYSGPSPDERALVLAAARAGVALRYRDSSRVIVRALGEEVAMEVLHAFEFSSERKKSSVLVRDPSGRLLLLVKGADSVVLSALSDSTVVNSPSRVLTAQEQMKVYSSNGLRVLCIAEREVGFDEYRAWMARYAELSAQLKAPPGASQDDRQGVEQALEALVVELESQLTFVGVSAIEDKIQDGAPETLQKLREAGVKVWMLTGDRPDTTTNVAHSVRLVTSEMKLLRLCGAPELNEGREQAEALLRRVIRDANKYQRSHTATHPSTSLALLLDDHVVDAVFRWELEREFLDLCLLCESVLCARVSPKQKELIVLLVRRLLPHQVTLAIGDGANDVPMIQRAHIGVGIAGEEGHQAADASDYSLPSFQYLQRLVLVHGRAMNRRTAVLTLYVFYKNVLLVLPQFVYGAYCLYSGQSTYFDALLQLFNVCFTALPVLYFAATDEDISPPIVLAHPRLYADGARHEFLNLRLFAAWISEAVVASVLLVVAPTELLPLAPWSGQGKDNDLWAMGAAQNFAVVFLANARLLLEVSSDLRRVVALAAASVLSWWLVALVLSSAVAFGREFYGVLRVGATTHLLLISVWCSVTALALPFAGRVWRVLFAPLPRSICREIDFTSGLRAARNSDAIFPIDRDDDKPLSSG